MGGGHSYPVTPLSKDRIILVTGSSQGLGYEIAKWCAMMGATVVMACRSEKKTLEAIERINEEFKAEKDKGTSGLTDSENLALEFMQVDLASFQSVIKFTEEYKKSGKKLHVLFLNAGLGYAPYTKTEDGLEMVLQVNYLSQFLMTAKLLPIMKESGDDCRILLMSSLAQGYCDFDVNTINYTGPPEQYPHNKYYARSKLYQVMQMYSMVKRSQSSNITVNSINPGFVYTNFAAESSTLWKYTIKMFRLFLARTPEQAAKCSIDCATNPSLAGVTGQYYDENTVKQPSQVARNEEFQEQLWKETFKFLKDHLTEEDIAVMEGKLTVLPALVEGL